MQCCTRKHELPRLKQLIWVHRDASIPNLALWGDNIVFWSSLFSLFVVLSFQKSENITIPPHWESKSVLFKCGLHSTVLATSASFWPAGIGASLYNEYNEGLLVWFDSHLNVYITVCIRTHWYIDMYVCICVNVSYWMSSYYCSVLCISKHFRSRIERYEESKFEILLSCKIYIY